MSTTERATSLEKGLRILRVVADEPGLGVTQVALRMGLHKSSVSRLVAALIREGFLEREPESRGVRLGPDALGLPARSAGWSELIERARPVLRRLATETRATVNLAVAERGEVVFLDQFSDPRAPATLNYVGHRAPLHATATGKVLLAFGSQDVRAGVVGRPLRMETSETIWDPVQLLSELEEVRRTGLATVEGEYLEGVNAVAAPVTGPQGEVIAAIGVSAVAPVLAGRDLEAAGQRVKAAAAAISGPRPG